MKQEFFEEWASLPPKKMGLVIVMNKRMVVKIGGLLLCVLFFVAPLAQCSQDSSLRATGLEIASGTGKLMSNADTSYPIVFILLVIPAILVIIAFASKSNAMLRNVSVAGAASQIIFMIVAYAMMNSGEGQNAILNGAFELTTFNWFIVAIYVGLICFTQYCIKQENVSPGPPMNNGEQNHVREEP